MFEPGEKVVCVNDSFGMGIRDIYNALPKKGTVYTIRDIVPGQDFACKETVAVYLVELVNLPNEHKIEPGFQCLRFKSLETLDDEIYQKNKLFEPTLV